MSSLSPARLTAYRARTFGLKRRLRGVEEALAFVEARGFVFLWPIGGCDLPSLWTAVAGDRPVASRHDDPAHITWRWKDQMLDQRRWFYAKLLRGKATVAALAVLPYFYALSQRVDELDDYRLAYENGTLSRAACDVAEALRVNGPVDTVRLRRLAHLSSEAAKTAFDRALVELQRGLWVVPIGVAEAGAWRYTFIYELLDRWYPQTADEARPIDAAAARAELADRYLRSVGAAPRQAVVHLFGWKAAEVEVALGELQAAGRAYPLADGRWVTAELLD